VLLLPTLGRLFYFGDDWGLLSDYVDLGLGRWLLQPFGENFAPVFKLVWIASVWTIGREYLGLIFLLWICHAANVLFLGLLLRRAGFGPVALTAALLAFGLSWTNLESLTWSPQLSQLLSVGFFLLTWIVWQRAEEARISPGWVAALVLAGLVASGLSFARGVIGGGVLGLFGVGEQLTSKPLSSRYWPILAALVSSAIVFAATWHFSTGELTHLGKLGPRTLSAAALYATVYLTLNPLMLLLQIPWQEVGATLLIGVPASRALASLLSGATLILVVAALGIAVGKLTFVAIGLRQSVGKTRLCLLALLAFDIGNAAILGAGRSQLGFDTAFASRYQYVSWLTFAPFLGLTIQAGYAALVRHFGVESTLPRLATALVLLVLVLIVGLPWPAEAARWAELRGTATRQQYQSGVASEQLPYSTVTVGRARELGRRFDLR
jgi:hypothetical protein